MAGKSGSSKELDLELASRSHVSAASSAARVVVWPDREASDHYLTISAGLSPSIPETTEVSCVLSCVRAHFVDP